MTLDDLLSWWPIVLSTIVFIVWLVRLEMKVIQTQEEVVQTQKDLKAGEARSAERRAEDLANHQRSWDKMESVLTSVQIDIKELLQRTSK